MQFNSKRLAVQRRPVDSPRRTLPQLILFLLTWLSISSIATAQNLVPDGTFQCSARPLLHMSDQVYLDQFLKYLPQAAQLDGFNAESEPLHHAPGAGWLASVVRDFKTAQYRPRDVVCIVGVGVSPEQLRKAGAFDNYGGDTLLLTPLKSSDYDVIHSIDSTPFRSPTANLVQIVLDKYVRKNWGPTGDLCYVRGEIDEKCMQAHERRLESNKAMAAAFMSTTGSVQTSVYRIATYDPSPADSVARVANAAAWNAFLTSVVIQETLMAPVYTTLPSNKGAPFNVWTADLSQVVNAYSFRDVLGDFVSKAAVASNFRELLAIGNDFDTLISIRPVAVPNRSMKTSSDFLSPTSDAIDEMVRKYICNRGAGSLMPQEQLPDSMQMTLSIFHDLGCDTRIIQRSHLIDFRMLSSRDLSFVRDDLSQLSLENKLNEIEVQLGQLTSVNLRSLKSLLAIQRYVGQTYYQQKIASLQAQLGQLEAASRTPGFIEVASALGSLVTGYGAVTEGARALIPLLKDAPWSSLSDLSDYYGKNSKAFKDSANSLTSGFSDIGKGAPVVLSAIDKLTDSGASNSAIESLRNQINDMTQQEHALLIEVSAQIRNADAELITVFDRLNRLELAKLTFGQDVQKSLYPLVGLNFISTSAEGVNSIIKLCTAEIQAWTDGTAISTAPVLQSCPGSVATLTALRSCQRKAKDTSNVLAVIGKKRAYLVGTGKDALNCFQPAVSQVEMKRREKTFSTR